jgi:hypothetical protein
MMPVNKILCRGAGAQPGDIVDVVMERDDEVRDVEPPPELKLGEASLHPQERDGEFDQRRQTRRNQETPADEGNASAEDGSQVDGLAA